ncbi:hypothetical protein I5907_21250 [Panacibacter sp. DH6]|uniref:Uncharacterized protein n=1 Tax=Panacibacter microcysteis TaxID=2793269 RepID=A0A931ME80_9BACT|nr:hypothetical protein [Panacibacter microcysteis]MBG9378773.1 hypothetical protein [Panacibacter microcysteis]
MKKNKLMILLLAVVLLGGCVQEAHLKTVMVTLTVHNKKGIQAVGIRGNGNPLTWEQDYPMTAVVTDSVYHASFKTMTAFKFTEMKFTVDGAWELEGRPNRKVVYPENRDTVVVNAVFDQQD